MRENRKSGKLLWRAVQGGIVILTLLGFLKAIFISLDIDESYAVAQIFLIFFWMSPILFIRYKKSWGCTENSFGKSLCSI